MVGYLEEVRKYSDVSAFGRVKKFNIKGGWHWKWDKIRGSGGDTAQQVSEQSTNDDDDSDDSDGGVSI